MIKLKKKETLARERSLLTALDRFVKTKGWYYRFSKTDKGWSVYLSDKTGSKEFTFVEKTPYAALLKSVQKIEKIEKIYPN